MALRSKAQVKSDNMTMLEDLNTGHTNRYWSCLKILEINAREDVPGPIYKSPGSDLGVMLAAM